MNSSRPMSLTIALALLVLMGVGHLFVPFVPDAAKIPPPVVYGDIALGATGLAAALGLWQLKRWGMVLSLIILALNILSAAPGVRVAPNFGLHVVRALYVLLSVVSHVLLVLPSARKPFAAKNAHLKQLAHA